MKPGRTKASPYRYDRAAVRRVLETEGQAVALAQWPQEVVRPIARVLGIAPPYHKPRTTLTQEQVRLLGTKSDKQLAGEWGVPAGTVTHTRTLLGIQPVGWTHRHEQRDAALRSLTNSELADNALWLLVQRTGLRVDLIIAERRRRGIRRNHGRASMRPPPVMERRLIAIRALRVAYPSITLAELAEVFRITRERVRQIEQIAAVQNSDVA